VTRIRPVLAAPLAALTALVLVGGCSAGYDAQTIKPYAPSDGVLANSGSLRVLNALVISQDGSGRGLLSMTIVNRGRRDDRLTDITSPVGRVDLTGNRDLPAGGAVGLGAGTDPAATIEALARVPGQAVTLHLTFARAEPLTVRTVVVSPTGPYASLTPGPQTPEADTASPTGTASPTDTASATGTATPTDGSTPTASATPTDSAAASPSAS